MPESQPSADQRQEVVPTAITEPEPVGPIKYYFWCSAIISKKLEDTLCQFILSQLQASVQISEYVFYISTLGGDPYSGVNLYSFIKSLPMKTTAYNMGLVASAGVPFFLGFKERYGTPNCSFMIHQTSIGRDNFPVNVNVFDLQTQLQLLGAAKKHGFIEKIEQPILAEKNIFYITDSWLAKQP